MHGFRSWNIAFAIIICTAILIAGFKVLAITPTTGHSPQKLAHEKAYKVYRQKCLGCHDSIADPEKPGRTRDEWHIVVNIMHQHGLDLTDEESEQMIDLLYELRRGLEKDAG